MIRSAGNALRGAGAVLMAMGVLLGLGGAPATAIEGDFTEYAVSGTPYGIVQGPDGTFWFTDQMSHRIGRLDPGTGQLTHFQLAEGAYPQGLTNGPDGNVWFVQAGLGLGSIGRIVPSTGEITVYPLQDTWAEPSDIVTGPDGNLWFTQRRNNKIGRISPTTGQIADYSIPTPNTGTKNITLGPDDSLWFTQTYADQIGRLDPQTGQFTEYSTGIPDRSAPWDVTASADGNLWFTMLDGNAIGRLNPRTGRVGTFAVPTLDARPMGISPGLYGDVWFTESGANQIGRIDALGTIYEFSGMGDLSTPYYLTTAADGESVWFTQYGGQIGHMTDVPSGLLSLPLVSGSLQAGTPQQCTGEQWQTIGGNLPESTGVSWEINGESVLGATSRYFTPNAADVGKSLTCTVTANYRYVDVTVSAESEPVTILAQNSGPSGPAGPTGPTGPAGPAGAPGTVQLVTCTQQSGKKGKKPTRKCTTTVVSGKVTFTTTGKARVSKATLVRGDRAYRASVSVKGRKVRLLTPAVLPQGRYRLIVGDRVSRIRIG